MILIISYIEVVEHEFVVSVLKIPAAPQVTDDETVQALIDLGCTCKKTLS